MNYLSTKSVTIAALSLFCSTFLLHAQDQRSFREEFNQLSAQQQVQVKANATQKEDYSTLPSIEVLNDRTVHEFCKLLPRGLETLFTKKLANTQSTAENRRAHLWASYLSCKDSQLYYQGHRFFNSGHYTEVQINSALAEIKEVMNWLMQEEAKLDSI